MANQNQNAKQEAEEVATPEVGDPVQFSSIPLAEQYGGDGFFGMKEGPYAAVITRVIEKEGEVIGCDLTVFPPNVAPIFERNVPMANSAHDDGARNWNWPER